MDTVEYILQIKDEMSAHLKSIDGNVQKMNRSMHESKNVIGELQSRIFTFFAVDKIIEFGKESVKAFEEMRMAKVQLDNALSNRDVGITTDELVERAEEYSQKWIFTKDQILAAQVELTNFKNIAGNIYDRAEQVAINIASKNGGDLKQITSDIGRALNSPQMGIRLLRQFGVTFTKQERELLTSLQETGHMAQAQDMIFKQLESTYRGAADAAAATEEGQKKLAEHGFEELKEELGAIIEMVEIKMLPYFRQFVAYIRSDILPALKVWVDHLIEVARWIKQYWDFIKPILELVVAYKAVAQAVLIFKEAQMAMNIVAAANPYILLAAGVALLTKSIYDLITANEELDAQRKSYAENKELEFLRERYEEIQKTNGALTDQQIKAKLAKEEMVTLTNLRNKYLEQWRTGDKSEAGKNLIDVNQRLATLQEFTKSTSPDLKKKAGKPVVAGSTSETTLGNEKVTGQKMTNIYVNITNLVKEFTISKVTNMQESEGRIREIVVKALVTAVNDGQILAGQ